MKDTEYFAIEASLDDLKDKVSEYFQRLMHAGYDRKIRRSYAQYYGYGYDAQTDRLTAAGDKGEETRISVNTYRSILRYQLSLITSERPSYKVMPINTDYDSMASAVVGEDVLEYYLRTKGMEQYLIDAAESAIWSSEGFLAMRWDTDIGDVYGVDPDDNKPVMDGDIAFSVLNTSTVARDLGLSDSPWKTTIEMVNKYELAEKFPEKREEILGLTFQHDPMTILAPEHVSDDVCRLYTFYHKKTKALPEGKMVIYTENDKLLDIPLPYKEIPVYRISAAEMQQTGLGYTMAFDLLGLQEANDELYSAVVSNNVLFAKQCVLIPRDADINYRDLSDGLAAIDYNPEMGKIEALQLTQSSPETYNLMDRLETQMQNLSGINEVIRGDPSANLRSGNALALIAAQAIKYNSTLQHSYIRLLESCGTAALQFLQDFAETPRYVAVVGKSNRSFLKAFSKYDLLGVSRVVVDVGSSLMATSAGRVQVAENLLQQGVIRRPEQYLAVIETGKLDPIMESERTELMNIKSENEDMQDGKPAVAILTDTHTLHIREHRAVLDDPEARKNPQVVQAVLAHIAEHEQLWQQLSTRPAILMATNQQPSPPPPQPQQGSNPEVMGKQDPQAAEGMPSLPGAPAAASEQDAQAVDQFTKSLQP